MTNQAYKFTDRDVRENSRLTDLAKSYLAAYSGDFEFLLDARYTFLHRGGELSVATIRGVLNCMRVDPQWCHVLPETFRAEHNFTVAGDHVMLRPVNLKRPARITLRTRFKMPYVMSIWPTARLVHKLNASRSELWWYPHTGEYRWQVHAVCGGFSTRPPHVRCVDHIPADRTLCIRCLEASS